MSIRIGRISPASINTRLCHKRDIDLLDGAGNRAHSRFMALGEKLVEKGFLTKVQLATALTKQKDSPGEKIGEILVKLGYVTKEQVESSL